MARKKLNGRFYFELTTNHNLIGEYSSNHSEHSEPESASRIYSEDEDKNYDFTGEYLTVWHEDGDSIIANLKITAKPNCKNIYSLVWKSTKDQNVIYFTGEAMLYRNAIIGDYRPGR